jgi:hypothetical protein
MKCSGGSWDESSEESSDEELKMEENKEDKDVREECEGLPVDYGDSSDEEDEQDNSLGNEAFLVGGDSSVVLEIVEAWR